MDVAQVLTNACAGLEGMVVLGNMGWEGSRINVLRR